MAFVGMNYDLPRTSFRKKSLDEGDLEKVIKVTEGLKSANKIFGTDYPDIRLMISPSSDNISGYQVFLEGDKDSLTTATSHFIHTAGIPNFVTNGYDIVDQILDQYGKTTKRKFSGFLYGKHVVDKIKI